MLTKIKINLLSPKNHAFSLIELSVVLVVISIILGFGFEYAAKKTDYDRIAETKNKIKQIEKSLYSYLTKNRRIPCPSHPDLPESDVNFGMAQIDTDPTLCLQSPQFPGLRMDNMVWGSIPIHTLGINSDLSYDGWGRLFSYIMIDQCNASETINASINFNSSSCGGSNPNRMTINDASGSLLMDNAIILIISHGKNGHGSFIGNNSNKRISIAATLFGNDEQENAHLASDGVTINPALNKIFVARSVDFNSNANNYSDDIIWLKNKNQLIGESSSIYYTNNSACNIMSHFNNSLVNASQLCGTKTNANCQVILNGLKDAISNFCY